MVKYIFRVIDISPHIHDADQRIIFDIHGPRIITICPTNTAMNITYIKPISCDCALGQEYRKTYTMSTRFKTLIRGQSHGNIVINVRTRRISFTHELNGLIRRVSDTLSDAEETFYIDTEDASTFPLRLDRWKQFIHMLKDMTTRVDVSDTSVTFSGDDCGAAYECHSCLPCTFEMKYKDFKFIYDIWGNECENELKMGLGANGIIFIRGKNLLGQQCTGYISPIS